MKFFRKRPDTPENQLAESADGMIALALIAGMGGGIVVCGLDVALGLLTGRVETPTWPTAIGLISLGLIVAFGFGLNVYRKRLKAFASPVEEPGTKA